MKILKNYQSLYRELTLESPFPNLDFQSEVVPVVILHEHCDGEFEIASASLGGVQAPQNLFTIPFPVSGAFQIAMYCNWLIAIAAQEAFRFTIDLGATHWKTIWYLDVGYAGATAGREQWVIPKLHIPEGAVLRGELLTTTAAGDFLTMGAVIQPI